MRAGIPDPAIRSSTITVYTDVDALCEALELPDASTVAALVLYEGHVAAGVRGPVDEAEAERVLSPALRVLDGHAT